MTDYILCVDDEAVILLAMKQELKRRFRERFCYETAENADEALEIAEEIKTAGNRISIVFTDKLMPGMKGDRLIDRLKHIFPEIAPVLMTGLAEEMPIDTTENRTGAYRILWKPWRSGELIRIVENCLEHPINRSSPPP